jgi:hypothetical protein
MTQQVVKVKTTDLGSRGYRHLVALSCRHTQLIDTRSPKAPTTVECAACAKKRPTQKGLF